MSKLLVTIILVFASMTTGVVAQGSEDKRSQLLQVARDSLAFWLSQTPEGRLAEYGLESDGKPAIIGFLPPIPVIVPAGENANITVQNVQQALDVPFTQWIVPLTANGRIASIMTVIDEVQQFRVVEFGKPLLANRLRVGIEALGPPESISWQDLRYLSFVVPAVDLLLVSQKENQWKWIVLSGTMDTEAKRLDAEEIEELIDNVRNARSDFLESNAQFDAHE